MAHLITSATICDFWGRGNVLPAQDREPVPEGAVGAGSAVGAIGAIGAFGAVLRRVLVQLTKHQTEIHDAILGTRPEIRQKHMPDFVG